MLQMKFSHDRTAGLRDIHVESMNGGTDGRRLESHTSSSSRAFGSGELKRGGGGGGQGRGSSASPEPLWIRHCRRTSQIKKVKCSNPEREIK